MIRHDILAFEVALDLRRYFTQEFSRILLVVMTVLAEGYKLHDITLSHIPVSISQLYGSIFIFFAVEELKFFELAASILANADEDDGDR